MSSSHVERRLMTPDEMQAVERMACVTYPVGSWDKRFMRNLSGEMITDKESAQLWRLFIKYRRQMSFPDKDRLLLVAERLAAPDFRKLEAQRRAQERIDETKRKYLEAMKDKNACVVFAPRAEDLQEGYTPQ